MRCDQCQATQNTIIDSTPGADGSIVRRRACGQCAATWETVEVHRAVFDTMVTMLRTQKQHTEAMLALFGRHKRLVRKKRST